MNILKCFLLVSISLFFACSKCDDIPINKVNIRFLNEVGFDLVRVTSGGAMYKGVNSFSSCSLDVLFEDVSDGELTDYQTTIGNHLGYNNARITWRRPEGHTTSVPTSRERFDAEKKGMGLA